MHDGQASKRVLPVTNLREFFKDELHGALEKRQLAVEDQTEHYVVNLLTLFSRSEELYDATPEGTRLKPLVVMLSEALEARSADDRNRSLQRLGDVSLFIAGFFAPFSLVDPNLSLFLWQLMSVVALALSVTILSRVSRIKISELFFLSFLYGPVFLTLWAGQLGLGFGLLPLCIGYFLLLRQMPFAAGIVWSFLLLKPQYFFAPAFVALVNALTGRYRTLTGMSVGVVCLIVLTTAAFSTPLTVQWLLSHRVSDAYFFSGLQGIPSHLLTGLPANLLILFSVNERELVKLPLYAGAAAMWLFGFWFCSRFKKLQMAESAQISVTFVVGLVLSSLTLPHLLYYDLCILLPAGVLLLARDGPLPKQIGLQAIGVSGWIAVSGFLPLLLLFANQKLAPLLLELILLILFVWLLKQLNQFCKLTARA